MFGFENEEQKTEYEMELIRMKALAYTELNCPDIKKINKIKARYQFVLSFFLAIAAVCLVFLLGYFSKLYHVMSEFGT